MLTKKCQANQIQEVECLQTNYQSPHAELFSTQSRQMVQSTFQRKKLVTKTTTISIFTSYKESDFPKYQIKNHNIGLLKKIFNQVYFAKIFLFLNSLKHYQRQKSILRTNYINQRRKYILPFYPDDMIIEKWKTFVQIITFCTVILYPIYICYDVRKDLYLLIFIIGIIFLTDIFINCLTCSVDFHHNLVTDIPQIIKQYLKTWLIFDIIAAIQLDRESELFVYFKMIRVLKYFLQNKSVTYKGQLNHIRLIDSFTPHEELNIQTGTKYLITVFINACLLIHIFSCFEHQFKQFPYITTVYWATQTITTVGYGDLNTNYFVSIIWMIVGVAFYSFTIGNFAVMMLKSKVNQETDILFSIEQLSLSQDLPEKLKYHCLTFIKNNLVHNSLWLEEYKEMVKLFPYQIKNYIAISSLLSICLQIPFFLYDINYTQFLLQHIRCIQVEQGQQLYREGQGSSEIFFLVKGDIRILTKDQGILLNILEGTMFGEFEAIEEKLRGTYCVAYIPSFCIVIPYRFLRKVMIKSSIIDFEVKQLHLRRRKLIVKNFVEEKQRQLEYKRQNARFFKESFLHQTRQDYKQDKQKQQLLSISQYNNLLLQKVLGKKKQRLQQFIIKFQRSVQQIIKINHILDETMPDQWKELPNYLLIKRAFPKRYLENKYDILSISRKSSSVHSSISRMKYSSLSQQYFFNKLPEVKLKHIVIQHVRERKNKYVPLEQIVDKYKKDPEALYYKQRENIGRSKWNKQQTRISQTIILRVDQVEECGIKYFSLLQTMKNLELIWLKGSMQKFELFQQMHCKEKQYLL